MNIEEIILAVICNYLQSLPKISIDFFKPLVIQELKQLNLYNLIEEIEQRISNNTLKKTI